MEVQFAQYLTLLLITTMLFVGLSALIGGIRKSPKPFFWLKDQQRTYLKTPTHYVLFGLVITALSLFFMAKRLGEMDVI